MVPGVGHLCGPLIGQSKHYFQQTSLKILANQV